MGKPEQPKKKSVDQGPHHRFVPTKERATRDPFHLGGLNVSPGHRGIVNFPLPSTSRYSSVSLPVHVIHGRHEGPTLFLTGAIHGDEINGIEIIRRILKSPLLRSLKGTVLAMPVVNVYGFSTHSRYLPDRRDLNRSFPGSERGSLAARLAFTLTSEILAGSDYGIDFHTGSNHRSNLPHIRANLDDEQTRRLAESFGTPVIINANLRDGSLRQWGAENEVRILLCEAGEALRFDPLSIRAGVKGALNVMYELGMIRRPPASRGHRADVVVARRSSWLRSSQSGLVRFGVKLGERVEAGEQVGSVSDTMGEHETPVVSRATGIVIGMTRLPIVNEGDALLHLADFSDSEKVEQAIEAFQEHHLEGLGPGDYEEDVSYG